MRRLAAQGLSVPVSAPCLARQFGVAAVSSRRLMACWTLAFDPRWPVICWSRDFDVSGGSGAVCTAMATSSVYASCRSRLSAACAEFLTEPVIPANKSWICACVS